MKRWSARVLHQSHRPKRPTPGPKRLFACPSGDRWIAWDDPPIWLVRSLRKEFTESEIKILSPNTSQSAMYAYTHTYIYIYIITDIQDSITKSNHPHFLYLFSKKNNIFLGVPLVPHANRLAARLVDLLRRQIMHLLVLQNQLPRGLAEGKLQRGVETPAEISVETC